MPFLSNTGSNTSLHPRKECVSGGQSRGYPAHPDTAPAATPIIKKSSMHNITHRPLSPELYKSLSGTAIQPGLENTGEPCKWCDIHTGLPTHRSSAQMHGSGHTCTRTDRQDRQTNRHAPAETGNPDKGAVSVPPTSSSSPTPVTSSSWLALFLFRCSRSGRISR